MELRDAILGRKSTRSYRKEPVPSYLLNEFLMYANHAPSAGGLKSRMFLIIDKVNMKEELSEAAGQEFIAEAPVVIVACTQITGDNPYGDRAELYAIQDTAAAIEHILLLAHEAGLGACWVGAFDEDKVRDILKLPTYERPMALIPMGYYYGKI